MSERVETWRLFVAIYPPPEIAAATLDEAKRLRTPGRAPPVEQVHLTVLFMGDRPAADVPAIESTLRAATAGLGPVTLTPREIVTLPARAPRLLVLVCDATPNLPALYARLVPALTTPGERAAGRVRDALLPHFTLRRFGRDDRVRPVRAPVRLGPMECRELVLVRSELGKGQAGRTEHTPVARVPLQ